MTKHGKDMTDDEIAELFANSPPASPPITPPPSPPAAAGDDVELRKVNDPRLHGHHGVAEVLAEEEQVRMLFQDYSFEVCACACASSIRIRKIGKSIAWSFL